jgi:hypothetical protein
MTDTPPLAPNARAVKLPRRSEPKLKRQGGSDYDIVNNVIINQTANAGWFPRGAKDPASDNELIAVYFLLEAFKPQDEIEGMLAAQAVALHNGAMEWTRRAMIQEQGFEAGIAYRKAAATYSRAFTEVLTALDRKRGKGGQQRVIVEHVSVHAGGQAIVGSIDGTATGGRGTAKSEAEPHASPARLEDNSAVSAVLPAMWRENAGGAAMPVASDAERAMPPARRR